MKLNRRFYDATINFRAISKERFIMAILIGLLSALTIYSFFYVIRETFRVMSVSFDNIPNIISESDRNFYNLFFAGISLIFGNSIFVSFIFSGPQNILSRRNLKRNRILNDQIFLNGNFAYWLTKIGLVFGVFSMCCMDFEFLPHFKFFAYVLLFVLYLESWKTLSTVFKKNRYKSQGIHFIILLFLTFGLSQLNVIDYKSIDKVILQADPIHNVPHADFYYDKKSSNYNVIIFKIEVDEEGKVSILTGDKNRISYKGIAHEVAMLRASVREEQVPLLAAKIIADRSIKLSYIKMVEVQLYAVSQLRVNYDVYNPDILSRRFEGRGLKKRISPHVLEFSHLFETPLPPLPPTPFIDDRIQYKDTLKIQIGEKIVINNVVVPKNMLVRKFKQYIDKTIAFEYIYNEHTSYQEYITVLSSHFKAAYELRAKKQTIFKDPNEINIKAYRKEQRELRKKYPLVVIETLH